MSARKAPSPPPPGACRPDPPPAPPLADDGLRNARSRALEEALEALDPYYWDHHSLMCGSPSAVHFKREVFRLLTDAGVLVPGGGHGNV